MEYSTTRATSTVGLEGRKNKFAKTYSKRTSSNKWRRRVTFGHLDGRVRIRTVNKTSRIDGLALSPGSKTALFPYFDWQENVIWTRRNPTYLRRQTRLHVPYSLYKASQNSFFVDQFSEAAEGSCRLKFGVRLSNFYLFDCLRLTGRKTNGGRSVHFIKIIT